LLQQLNSDAGINAIELISKMLFMHPRKSKRRDAIVAVQKLLTDFDSKHAVAMSLSTAPSASPTGMGEGSGPYSYSPSTAPTAAGAVFASPAFATVTQSETGGEITGSPAPFEDTTDPSQQGSAVMTRTMVTAAMDIDTPAAEARPSNTPATKEVLLAKANLSLGHVISPAIVRAARAAPIKEAVPTPIPFRGLGCSPVSSANPKKPKKQFAGAAVEDSSAFSSVPSVAKRPRLSASDAAPHTDQAHVSSTVKSSVSRAADVPEVDVEDSYLSDDGNDGPAEGQDADLSSSYVMNALANSDAVEKCLAMDAIAAVQTRIPKAASAAANGSGKRAIIVVGGPSLQLPYAVAGSSISLCVQDFTSLRSLVNACNSTVDPVRILVPTAASEHVPAATVDKADVPRAAERSPSFMGYRYAYGYGRSVAQSVMSSLSFASVSTQYKSEGAPYPYAIPPPAQSPVSALGISPHLAAYPDLATHPEFAHVLESMKLPSNEAAAVEAAVVETSTSVSPAATTIAKPEFAPEASPATLFSMSCPVVCGVFFSPMSLSAPSTELFIQTAMSAHQREAAANGGIAQLLAQANPTPAASSSQLRTPRLKTKLHEVVLNDAVARRARQLFEPFGHAFRSMIGSMVTNTAACVMMVLCRPAATPEAFPVQSIFPVVAEATVTDDATVGSKRKREDLPSNLSLEAQSSMLSGTAQDLWSATMSLMLRSFSSSNRQLLSASGHAFTIDSITVETVARSAATVRCLAQTANSDSMLREYVVVTVSLVPGQRG
jgi:hypothetical protein